MDWDPFEDVDLDAPDSPELLRERVIAHARELDPKVTGCLDCGDATEAWVVRRGTTGEGVCRTCMTQRDADRPTARAFAARLRAGLEALHALRAARDAAVAREIATVPF